MTVGVPKRSSANCLAFKDFRNALSLIMALIGRFVASAMRSTTP